MILLLMLGILVVPYLLLTAAGAVWPDLAVEPPLRGRIGLSLLFLFTASGHFARTKAMSEMLPPRLPGRVAIVYGTGVLEIAGAIGLLVPSTSRAAGICLLIFLVAVLPANVYGAIARVDFGGHGAGARYLWLRVPMQLFLMGWTYRFAVLG